MRDVGGGPLAMMGPSRGDTICGNVAIDALGPMQFGALVLGPIHIAHTPTEPKIWLVTIERTLLPRSVDVSRFMAGVGELANATIPGAVPIVLVDREADFCVVGYRAVDGARTLATITEAGPDREAAGELAVELAETLAAIQGTGAVHGLVTPTTVIHDGTRWRTWEHGIVAHCSADRLGPRLRPLGGDVVAPELRAGTPLSPASDVFGWGAAVACLLTGASGADAVAMVQDEDDEGDPLRELVRSALDPIAELRPRDAAALRERLRAVGVSSRKPPESVATPPVAIPGPSESAEFSFADLNEPSIEEETSTPAEELVLDEPLPPPPPPPARTESASEVVELLDLDPEPSGEVVITPPPAPEPPPSAAAVGRTAPSTEGAPDTSERWRALAEQYLAAEIADERPSGEIELTEAPIADRRAIEALGRVTLVRARVRTGAQRTVSHDGAAVSGTFDAPDEPDPDPETPPRHVEGARDLPLGSPAHDEADDWEENDEAVFDLDAPGMPRVDAGANEADEADADEAPADERRLRDTIAPWNEPTPVDGLGTRKHAAAARSAAPEPSPTTTPAAPPEVDDPEPSPRPALAPSTTRVTVDAPKPARAVRAPEPGAGLVLRAPSAVEDLRATPIDPFAENTPLPASRARPVEPVSSERAPRLAPERPAPRPSPAPAPAFPTSSPGPTRTGTLVAWLIIGGMTVTAVAATLAAARQRGGLSQLLDAGTAPARDEDRTHEETAPTSSEGAPATAAPTDCPSTMRRIDGMPVCIDQAEAPGIREIPSTAIALDDARRACRERGARLCTTAQWRAACRGPKQWRHPYGNRPEHDRCNGAAASGEIQDLSRTGARDRCKTPAGVYDLAGNVAEWVEEGAALGGDSSTRAPSCDTRVMPEAGAAAPTIGYRCCLDLAPGR